MTRDHPDLLRLDAVRAGDGTEDEELHVASCAVCSRAVRNLHELARNLGYLSTPPFPIPDKIERRILWNARKQAAQVKKHVRPRLTPQRARASRRWAIAAAVVLALGTLTTWERIRTVRSSETAVARVSAPTNAANTQNRIDILQAFALARALNERTTISERWDVNHDGVVDQRDVDALARAAVSLGDA